jgi:hypothetical protein
MIIVTRDAVQPCCSAFQGVDIVSDAVREDKLRGSRVSLGTWCYAKGQSMGWGGW